MAVTAKWFGQAIVGQFSATAARRIAWAGDTVKVALVKGSYAPNQDTHDFWNDVSANEVAGTNYTAGGKSITEKAVSYDEASNTTRLKGGNVEWKEVTVKEVRYAVIYKDTGVAGESPLLGYVDFGEEQAITGGTFKVEWDTTDGVLRGIVS